MKGLPVAQVLFVDMVAIDIHKGNVQLKLIPEATTLIAGYLRIGRCRHIGGTKRSRRHHHDECRLFQHKHDIIGFIICLGFLFKVFY